MTRKTPAGPIFTSAAEDVQHAELYKTEGDSYRLAYNDERCLLRDELRAVRLQLEWLKPDLIQEELGIESTVVIFGGARFPDPEAAAAALQFAHSEQEKSPQDPALAKKVRIAQAVVKNSRFYQEARI